MSNTTGLVVDCALGLALLGAARWVWRLRAELKRQELPHPAGTPIPGLSAPSDFRADLPPAPTRPRSDFPGTLSSTAIEHRRHVVHNQHDRTCAFCLAVERRSY